jgi:hypothetical protein
VSVEVSPHVSPKPKQRKRERERERERELSLPIVAQRKLWYGKVK